MHVLFIVCILAVWFGMDMNALCRLEALGMHYLAPLAPVIMSWVRVRFRVGLALGLGLRLLLGLWLGCRWSKRHYHQRQCAGAVIDNTHNLVATTGLCP